MRRVRALLAVAVLSLAGGAMPRAAGAQEDAPTGELSAALASVRPGTVVRVHSGGGDRLEGVLVGVEADALMVEVAGTAQRIPGASVEAVWARGRQTRRGATIGGVVVGGAALLYGAFLGMIISATGYDDGEAPVLLGLGSGALGAAGGALAGGVIGSTLSRWYQVYPAGRTGQVPDSLPADAGEAGAPERVAVEPRRLGSAEVTAGYARSPQDGGTDGGLAGRAALVAEFARGERGFLGVGLEAGGQSLGGTGARLAPEVRQVCDPECEYRVDSVAVQRRYRVYDVGGVLRAGWARQGLEPYGVLGLGMQVRRTETVPVDEPIQIAGTATRVVAGYSVGAGARLRRPATPWTLGVEGRWHSNLLSGQSDGLDEAFGFWTVGATLNRRW
jgi:hypothetical protein